MNPDRFHSDPTIRAANMPADDLLRVVEAGLGALAAACFREILKRKDLDVAAAMNESVAREEDKLEQALAVARHAEAEDEKAADLADALSY